MAVSGALTVIAAGVICLLILLARLPRKPDPLEWHIPQYGLVTEKPPCGRWKYLGTVPLRLRLSARQHADKLGKKGIVVTPFRVCTKCGESQVYPGPDWTWADWERDTFESILVQVKTAEAKESKESREREQRIRRDKEERAKIDRTFADSRAQALDWLKKESK